MKHPILPSITVALFLLLALTTGGGSAWALYLGSPTPTLKTGALAVGGSFSDYRTTVFGDYGVNDQGTLEVQLTNVDLGAGVSGSEFGFDYHYGLNKSVKLGKYDVQLGFLGGYWHGSESVLGVSVGSSALRLGLGGSMSPAKNVGLYGAVMYERRTYATVVPFFGTVSATESNFGLNVGGTFSLTPQAVIGVELHPGLNDDGLAVFGRYRF